MGGRESHANLLRTGPVTSPARLHLQLIMQEAMQTCYEPGR